MCLTVQMRNGSPVTTALNCHVDASNRAVISLNVTSEEMRRVCCHLLN